MKELRVRGEARKEGRLGPKGQIFPEGLKHNLIKTSQISVNYCNRVMVGCGGGMRYHGGHNE